jgi:hypothetical protein
LTAAGAVIILIDEELPLTRTFERCPHAVVLAAALAVSGI